MLLSVAAEYRTSPLVKMLEIDEETGELKIAYVDSSDENSLEELQEKLSEGVTFSDFQIIKTKAEDNLEAYELRHFCTNIAPGEPDLSLDGVVVKDSPSFAGFIRKMIVEGSSIILPGMDAPEQDIPHWMTANVNTIQFSDDMGMRISHLVPADEEGYWRWTTSTILMADNNDIFGDVTHLKFLCLTEFDEGEYSPFLVEHPERTVVKENGIAVTYRVFSVVKELPIYPKKSNVMITPAIISRLKFVADSYKLALYSLTEGLFEDKKIQSSGSWPRNAPMVTGRYLKIKNDTPINKKTASAMLDFLLRSMQGQTVPSQERSLLRLYPHYQVYASIIKSQTPNFFGNDVTKAHKMRAYRALKNVETLYYLLLQECRYNVMFDNNSYLFNLWTSTGSFNSDIPNYKVTIGGGGGTWRPNDSYFW